MSAIRFADVTKKFADASHAAVAGVSFEVETGSFVVLLGPSGCGKTTLMKMVNRLYEPTSGTIFVGDDDITTLDKIALRRRIGYVIQQVGLFPHMTVAENVGVVPDLLKWPREKITARVNELLELVELPPHEYATRYPGQLSGGQQQRVGVARALAGEPEVILMDEPFGAIDAITRTTLQDELLYLQQKLHKTILFVTHDVEEALRLADQIVIMRAGQVVQMDSPVNILRQPVDAFVSQLMGSQDMLRLLRLVKITAVMTPFTDTQNDPNFTLPHTADCHTALSLLLPHPNAFVLVENEAGQPVGRVDLGDIQQLLQAEMVEAA